MLGVQPSATDRSESRFISKTRGYGCGVRAVVVPLLATLALVGCAATSRGSPSGSPAALATGTPSSTASPSPTSSGIPGCVPECLHGGADPGTLPAGPYTMRYFLAGQLTVKYAAPWESHEDQPVEFSSAPLGMWDTHRVLFWSDILPVGPDGRLVGGVPRTAAGMLAWFATRKNLRVSKPLSATIGAQYLPAKVIDINIAPTRSTRIPAARRRYASTS